MSRRAKVPNLVVILHTLEKLDEDSSLVRFSHQLGMVHQVDIREKGGARDRRAQQPSEQFSPRNV
ncbi:hypothetical protein F1880_009603 [Penicillium rolfsii]|nr:hypothetical protein F1880_009603 [Penicillium rolfsii]